MIEDRPSSPAAGPDPAVLSAIPLSTITALSTAALAMVALGFSLYVAREVLLPIAAAFVVGVTLSPIAKRLESLRVPRALAAVLIVAGVALVVALVIALVVPRVSELTDALPNLAGTWRDRLHALDGLAPLLRQFGVGSSPSDWLSQFAAPSLAWVPSTIGVLWPPVVGFLFFLVVLLLFITKWPDLRRGLVMTFASRDSRLTVLRILNDVETGLANYLLTVSLINLGVGLATGAICWATAMPHAVGFGALAATLNFIPIIGPAAIFVVLVMIGVVAAPGIVQGLIPAACFTLVVTVEGHFVTPTIVGRQLELNGLAVLLSLAFWTWLWGPVGAFLSSPILIVALIVRQRLYVDE